MLSSTKVQAEIHGNEIDDSCFTSNLPIKTIFENKLSIQISNCMHLEIDLLSKEPPTLCFSLTNPLPYNLQAAQARNLEPVQLMQAIVNYNDSVLPEITSTGIRKRINKALDNEFDDLSSKPESLRYLPTNITGLIQHLLSNNSSEKYLTNLSVRVSTPTEEYQIPTHVDPHVEKLFQELANYRDNLTSKGKWIKPPPGRSSFEDRIKNMYEAAELYRRCFELRQASFSLPEISKMLCVTERILSGWLNNDLYPTQLKILKKDRQDFHFDLLKENVSLGFYLGAFLGNLTKSTTAPRKTFTSKDLGVTKKLQEAVVKIYGQTPPIKIRTHENRTEHLLDVNFRDLLAETYSHTKNGNSLPWACL
jgi:hypothetical protein